LLEAFHSTQQNHQSDSLALALISKNTFLHQQTPSLHISCAPTLSPTQFLNLFFYIKMIKVTILKKNRSFYLGQKAQQV